MMQKYVVISDILIFRLVEVADYGSIILIGTKILHSQTALSQSGQNTGTTIQITILTSNHGQTLIPLLSPSVLPHLLSLSPLRYKHCMHCHHLTLYPTLQVMMGRRGVVNAKVSLSLQLILNNGTRIMLTEGFPLLMTDDGVGGDYLMFSYSL